MTSREIILGNISHDNPERPGLSFNRGRLNDFCGAGVGPSAHWQGKRWVEDDIEYYDDEWGNIWYRFVYGSQGGEIYRPALEDWAQLKDLRVPDFDNPARFEHMRNLFAKETSKFRLASIPGWVFATSRYLRKMEIYFMDLLLERDHIEELHDIVTSLYERMIIQCAQAGADGIFFCEDLGTQDRVLIGPSMWREIFASHYQRLCSTAHAYGMKVIMHSCGYNWELIDDLIDNGIDCLQFDQPAAYDQEGLSSKLQERGVGLWSPVDIQRIMPTGDRQLIESEARRMVQTYRGGLIMGNYGDIQGIGIQAEWDDWAYYAVLDEIGIDAP